MACECPGECKVTVPSGLEIGEYANAFRVVHDGGADWFLDFLVVNRAEQVARLVARIRVQQMFLDPIRDRLAETLTALTEGDPIPVMPVASGVH